MNDWNKYSKPGDDRYVLVCTATKKGQKNIKIGYWNGERWCVGMNDNVIAWMDLPDLPEDESL